MTLNIGEAAKASGVSAKMIRYYESIGLIGRVRRSEAGYRVYSQADIHTLTFIRRAHYLGFLVEDIRGLLDLWQDRDRASAKVKDLVQHHLALLRAKIVAIESMCRTLERLACECPGDERPDCPILDDLSDQMSAPVPASKMRAPGGLLSGSGRSSR